MTMTRQYERECEIHYGGHDWVGPWCERCRTPRFNKASSAAWRSYTGHADTCPNCDGPDMCAEGAELSHQWVRMHMAAERARRSIVAAGDLRDRVSGEGVAVDAASASAGGRFGRYFRHDEIVNPGRFSDWRDAAFGPAILLSSDEHVVASIRNHAQASQAESVLQRLGRGPVIAGGSFDLDSTEQDTGLTITRQVTITTPGYASCRDCNTATRRLTLRQWSDGTGENIRTCDGHAAAVTLHDTVKPIAGGSDDTETARGHTMAQTDRSPIRDQYAAVRALIVEHAHAFMGHVLMCRDCYVDDADEIAGCDVGAALWEEYRKLAPTAADYADQARHQRLGRGPIITGGSGGTLRIRLLKHRSGWNAARGNAVASAGYRLGGRPVRSDWWLAAASATESDLDRRSYYAMLARHSDKQFGDQGGAVRQRLVSDTTQKNAPAFKLGTSIEQATAIARRAGFATVTVSILFAQPEDATRIMIDGHDGGEVAAFAEFLATDGAEVLSTSGPDFDGMTWCSVNIPHKARGPVIAGGSGGGCDQCGGRLRTFVTAACGRRLCADFQNPYSCALLHECVQCRVAARADDSAEYGPVIAGGSFEMDDDDGQHCEPCYEVGDRQPVAVMLVYFDSTGYKASLPGVRLCENCATDHDVLAGLHVHSMTTQMRPIIAGGSGEAADEQGGTRRDTVRREVQRGWAALSREGRAHCLLNALRAMGRKSLYPTVGFTYTEREIAVVEAARQADEADGRHCEGGSGEAETAITWMS